mmetsp:Transcript_20244/g.29271  ORF Transcript_20244/g.29271 Transcript_20244/m.29271 type:complete len:306 (-) Transcript_20244:198-1115(-)
MTRFTRLAFLLYGRRHKRAREGSSVPRARAPIVSMMRLTHSIITAFRIGSLNPMHAPIRLKIRATKFTVSWNCRNLRMLSNTVRPHSTALTIEENLSSRSTMSDASRATSVPHRPILSPTSAAFRAGASFVPSPVTPTTCPTPFVAFIHSSKYPGSSLSLSFFQFAPGCIFSHSSLFLGRFCPLRRVTNKNLSWGDARAITCSLGRMLSRAAGVRLRKVGPSSATSPLDLTRIPQSRAMAQAVSRLSPVTMRTCTPASWQVFTASGTSGRRGSWIPTTASSTSCTSTSRGSRSISSPFWKSGRSR